MYISVQSKTMALTEAIRLFAERQISRIFRRRERINSVTVFVETVARKKNDMQATMAKIKVSLPGRDIVVERKAQDLYKAIADVSVRAARAVRKVKEKRLDFKRMPRWVDQEVSYSTAAK